MSDTEKTVRPTSESFMIEPSEFVEVIDEFSKLLRKIELYNPHVDKELIKRALRYAAVAHSGQRRKSGKPFIYHGIQTAGILADLHLDSVMIACGILHDIVEDTSITVGDVRAEFGDDIANIIEGLTKIAAIQMKNPEERQAENFRKMILYSAKDARTVLVKFADRLHNMRTLRFLRAEKRRQISRETLEVFAPLAHRFGVYTIKKELEDLSFRWLYPKEYREVKKAVKKIVTEQDDYLEQVIEPVRKRLNENGIEHSIQWRLKHLYSIFNKMERDHKSIDEIYDIYAVRIIVDSISDCYNTLGIIHSMFTPVVDRIKDFIATPKFNMYQSLHTTVIGPGGRMVEVQIRTAEMHNTAESGIAAHWRYKEGKVKLDDMDVYMTWLRKMVDWQRGISDSKDFMKELKMDLFQDEIFVFTPKGDLIRLPAGSTPVDFAFALHTEIGLHCSGARVNKRIVPLDTELESGQWVEIHTNPNKAPNPSWLNIVKTAKARSLIRRWIKRQHADESRALAADMLAKVEKQLERKISEKEQRELVEKHHQRDWDQFLISLGSGDISIHTVRNFFDLGEKQKRGKKKAASQAPIGVSIQGMENLMVSFAKCCKPLPGDEIIGYVTRGRGMIVHRSDCEALKKSDGYMERTMPVEWTPTKGVYFVASIRIEATDRDGLLNDITARLTKNKCNIHSANIKTLDDNVVDDFDIEVESLTVLERLMKDIRNIKNVSTVTRLDDRSPANIRSADDDG